MADNQLTTLEESLIDELRTLANKIKLEKIQKAGQKPASLRNLCANYETCIKKIENYSKSLEDSDRRSSIGEVKQYISGIEMTKALSPRSQLLSLSNREDIEDFYEYTENCVDAAINSLTIPEESDIEHLKIDLPSDLIQEYKEKGKLAVFDLDETLIHCIVDRDKIKTADKLIEVKLPSGNRMQTMGINIRPNWEECLRRVSKDYLCIVYTASHQFYADAVLDELDKERKLLKHRLYRNNCHETLFEGSKIYVKEMRIFRGIDLKDIVMIDNSALSFAYQLDNGIPVMPFYDNKFDTELHSLVTFLKYLANASDVRNEISKHFKLHELADQSMEGSEMETSS